MFNWALLPCTLMCFWLWILFSNVLHIRPSKSPCVFQFWVRKERKPNRNKRFCWENHRLLSIENQKCSALNQAIRTWLEHFDVLRLFTNRWVMFVKRLHLIFQRTNLPLNCWMKFTIYYVNFNLWEISMVFLYLHIYS